MIRAVIWGDALVLPGGRTIIAAAENSPERMGIPIHLLDSTGVVVRSFAGTGGTATMVHPLFTRRHLAMARGGDVWIAHATDYVVERWDTAGVLRQRLTAAPPWFVSYPTIVVPPGKPPRSQIMGIVEDSLGRLWITTSTSDSRWASAMEDVRLPDGRLTQRVADYQRYYDTVGQVIDPRSGSLIASQRFDPYGPLLLDAAQLAGDVEVDGGAPRIRIWRMQLHTPP